MTITGIIYNIKLRGDGTIGFIIEYANFSRYILIDKSMFECIFGTIDRENQLIYFGIKDGKILGTRRFNIGRI